MSATVVERILTACVSAELPPLWDRPLRAGSERAQREQADDHFDHDQGGPRRSSSLKSSVLVTTNRGIPRCRPTSSSTLHTPPMDRASCEVARTRSCSLRCISTVEMHAIL